MEKASQPPRRRVALVGVDGFSPQWIERFLDEGDMPNLARVRRAGATVPLVSTLPATTPVAWASVATGCHPSATGIEGFLLHRPGHPLDRRVAGAYATRCRREPIWETAALWGRRAFVVKFPLSYPSNTAALRIDGAAGWGGIQCLHDAAAAGVVDSLDPIGGYGRVVDAPDAWAGEASMAILWRGRLELPSIWGKDPVVLAVSVTGECSPRLAVSPTADWADAVLLAPGDWSEPLSVVTQARAGDALCALRVKLIALEAGEGARPAIRLFHTAVHEQGGHSHPPELAARHLAHAGPIEEQTEPSLLLEGLIDVETQLERCRLNTDWLKRMATSILVGEDWDLFMVQIHIVDWAHHLLHGAVDPRHPLHDPEGATAAVDLLRRHYRMADELIGAVRERLTEADDLVVMGDHGQDLHHTTVRLNEVFAAAGLLRWAEPEGASDGVDWTGTRVYAAGNYVYLNQAGREPTGIVDATDKAALTARVVALLAGLVDPRTGEAPVRIAGPKARFADLGGEGEGVGDIVLCFHSGFHGRNDRGPVYELTRPLRDFTSGHDHFWPYDPRIETRLFAAGPSFRSGRFDRHRVIDVAPTLCAVLGFDPPAECEGAVIADILNDPVAAAPGLADRVPA